MPDFEATSWQRNSKATPVNSRVALREPELQREHGEILSELATSLSILSPKWLHLECSGSGIIAKGYIKELVRILATSGRLNRQGCIMELSTSKRDLMFNLIARV